MVGTKPEVNYCTCVCETEIPNGNIMQMDIIVEM